MLERSLRVQLALRVVIGAFCDLLAPGRAVFVARPGDALVQLAQGHVARPGRDSVAQQARRHG